MNWQPIETMPPGTFYMVKTELSMDDRFLSGQAEMSGSRMFVEHYQKIFYTEHGNIWPYKPTHWLKP